MLRKIYFLNFIIFINLFFLGAAFSNVKIIASVNNEIITDYDIQKEINYLKILSPNLINLNQQKLYLLAKQSLIDEIIKKNEISKFLDIEGKNSIPENYLESLIRKLGYESKENFIEKLMINETYKFDEFKKKIKIELFWNDLIYNKYNDQIFLNINEEKFKTKLDKIKKKKIKEFLLSEIVFKKERDKSIEETTSIIKKSIEEIGFNNAANIYSLSDSAKYGGKIGWIKESALSEKIYKQLVNLKIKEHSDIIRLNENFLILKIEDIKIIEALENKEKIIEQMIENEKNERLKKFSLIYFKKAKTQYSIYER